jgi:hypothetical protein
MKRSAIATLVLSLGLFGLGAPASASTKPLEPVAPKPTKPLLPKPPPKVKAKPKPGKPVQATLTVDYPAGTGTVTVTGAFSGDGTVETLKHKQAGRTRHFVEKLTFGSDSVNIKAVAVRVSRQLDASTCTVTEKHKGVWIITTGTGEFANVKGAGHLVATATVTGTPDLTKPNDCDLSNPTGTIVVNAKGRVKKVSAKPKT